MILQITDSDLYWLFLFYFLSICCLQLLEHLLLLLRYFNIACIFSYTVFLSIISPQQVVVALEKLEATSMELKFPMSQGFPLCLQKLLECCFLLLEVRWHACCMMLHISRLHVPSPSKSALHVLISGVASP